MFITLGIESTAHTFSVALMKHGRIVANERAMYQTKTGGMIPAQLADHHVDCCDAVLRAALDKAKVTLAEVDLIAFSQSPGIGNALRIGASMAKSLSLLCKTPLVGVNHCIAHLEIGKHFAKANDPILLYCSGANTQVIAYEGGTYRIFGETLDMGVGNFLDSLGRLLGLGFPAGPRIEQLARSGKRYLELPYSVKGMDVSFSGIFTHLRHKIAARSAAKTDMCFSVQETVFAMLVEVAERAMAHTGKNELVLGGGVACNQRLQEMAATMCKERKAKWFVPDNQYLVDNAAMIALTGKKMYDAGNRTAFKDAVIKPYERTDQVKVNWR